MLTSPELLLFLAGLLTGVGLALLAVAVRDILWILRYIRTRLRSPSM